MSGGDDRLDILSSQRTATRYRILVELTARQPAVRQSDIAAAVGITAQAVSDYLQDLVARNQVEKLGRGRYEVTKEGVDWLLAHTEALRDYTRYVSEEVVDDVQTVAAIADDEIGAGLPVSLSMDAGTLHAEPGTAGSHTAVAITDADPGRAVGVTDFQGMLEYEYGSVSIVSIPAVTEDQTLGTMEAIRTTIDRHDLLAVAGTEAEAVANRLDRSPDIRFGTPEAVQEAAAKGVDVTVLAVTAERSGIIDRLREHNIGFEVIEPGYA